MTSALNLERFLGELTTRRQRILQLAEPSGPRSVDLLGELNELAEQLLIADEELRVQQEELESARGALLSLSAERDLLLEHSTKAYAITDHRGVVEQLTRATQQLLQQPQVRITPRPIASWFEVADRRAVRGMITRLMADDGPQQAAGVHLRLAGGGQVRVDVLAEVVGSAAGGEPLLRWELLPAADRPHPLRAVKSDELPPAAPLALELAEAAVELQACATRTDLADVVLAATLRLVPGAGDAGLVLSAGDAAQLTEALAPAREGERLGRAAISAPLVVGPRRLGVLTVYAGDDDELTPESEIALTALAVLVAVAVRQRDEADRLQRAITSRQRIGQAVGILAERRQITPDEAFALLVSWSQDLNVKLRTLADSLVDTGREPPPPSRR
ncbi:ANTAR domain-containing protein [uncultured Friedmanniella sp.]|uniref:ANTAR domain-containing protein n=1 Tax=uncultured Friedmanniella sp. TaxID=335381 RepID=UPI0035CB772D